MSKGFCYLLLLAQAAATLFFCLMVISIMAESSRNPEAELAIFFIGYPLALGSLIATPIVYALRDTLPEDQRNMLLTLSIALLVTTLVALGSTLVGGSSG